MRGLASSNSTRGRPTGVAPRRWLRYALGGVFLAGGLSGSALVYTVPPIPPAQAARIEQRAILAFYRLGSIPRGSGTAWDTYDRGIQVRILRRVWPRELAALRANETGWALHYDLANDGFNSWIGAEGACCEAVRDVHVDSITGTRKKLHVNVTEYSRELQRLPSRRKPRALVWRGRWASEWIHMTLLWKNGRYRSPEWTASWAQDFHG